MSAGWLHRQPSSRSLVLVSLIRVLHLFIQLCIASAPLGYVPSSGDSRGCIYPLRLQLRTCICLFLVQMYKLVQACTSTSSYKLVRVIEYKLACRCSSTLYAQANVHACSSLSIVRLVQACTSSHKLAQLAQACTRTSTTSCRDAHASTSLVRVVNLYVQGCCNQAPKWIQPHPVGD